MRLCCLMENINIIHNLGVNALDLLEILQKTGF